ncbi:N-acetylmuramidase domain-containing protein, partial [Mesorhizobium sp.]|uniref:N-acetylmuramidase domain-containing protein n=1 Tax=Mesorhizobium sp. TaxID=1871066 RepID=UPI0025F37158
MDTSFKGAAARLKDIDIPRIGAEIGVGEDELHAFMQVQAAGSGFDASGRPKMLFEPHVFYRLLGKGAKRDAAVKAGLAYPKWGMQPYPRDCYPRLINAMAIDETAALMSASWGLTQILGENHRDTGYTSPQAMISAFMASEANHLEATVGLLVAWKV